MATDQWTVVESVLSQNDAKLWFFHSTEKNLDLCENFINVLIGKRAEMQRLTHQRATGIENREQ